MPSAVRQAAAIPIRDGMVCMVTSRSGRRWVLPKGKIESRQTPAQAAAAEAWEEAGLTGRLGERTVGFRSLAERCRRADGLAGRRGP